MGFFNKLFTDNDEITVEVEEFNTPKPTYNENDKLTLYSISGEIVAELMPDTRVSIVPSSDKKQSTILAQFADGTTTTIMSCDMPEESSGRTELQKMMDAFISDIARARRNGSEGIRIPINEYELYAYIRNRPEIEVDLDKLEEMINAHQKSSILTDFVNDLQTNKRVDIYVATNNIYNVEAARILRNSYEKFSNIHFFDIDASYDVNIFWNNPTIVDNIRHAPDAVNVGIGVEGDKPPHTLSITNDLEDSVIAKAAFVTNHPMNVREEMLNAQYSSHAVGIMEIAKKRTMSKEVARKVMRELAIDEAKYRHSDSAIKQYVDAVNHASFTEGHMRRIRAPFNDLNLALNLCPDEKGGVLIEVGYEEIVFYGPERAAKALKDLHAWTDISPNLAGQKTDKDSYRMHEKQASEITGKIIFIDEMSEVLQKNLGKSISAAYKNVKNLAEHFNSIGMDAEMQIRMLHEVPELAEDNYRKSIENIIREVLTKESPFLNFGEIFSKKRTKS